MRHLPLASMVLAVAAASEVAAATCYLPAEIEADQAIKLRAELKVVGEICEDPSYAIFSDHNHDTLAAYEQILSEYLARNPTASSVATYVAGLEKKAMEYAAQTPSFCADSFDTVTLLGGMRPSDLHAYAMAKAETAKPEYAICPVPAPVEAAPSNAAPLASASAAADQNHTATAPPTAIAGPVAAAAVAPVEAAPSNAVPLASASAAADQSRVAVAPVTAPASPAPATAAAASAAVDDDIRPSLGDAALARLLSRADRRRLLETTQQTLESARSGQMLGWRDPWSGGGATVVAARAFQNADSQWCRRFEQSVFISGTVRRSSGTACRRADGIWENVP